MGLISDPENEFVLERERYLEETQTMALISDLLRLSNGAVTWIWEVLGTDGSVIAKGSAVLSERCFGYG